jgi:hypothetical protein
MRGILIWESEEETETYQHIAWQQDIIVVFQKLRDRTFQPPAWWRHLGGTSSPEDPCVG